MISKRGRLYKEAVNRAVFQTRANKRLAGRLAVTIDLYPPDRRRRDIDNTVKACLDGLQNAAVFVDDSQVDHLTIRRMEIVRGGYAVVTVNEVSPIHQ